MEEVISLRMPNSTCRRPVGGYHNQDIHQNMAGSAQQMIRRMGGQPVKVASRRSRAETLTQPSQHQQYLERRSAQQRSAQPAPHTYDDDEIAPSTKPARRQTGYGPDYQQRRRGPSLKSLFLFCLGMLVMLILWIIGVHAYAWVMNTISDPYYYAQSAHRDVAVVDSPTTGKQYQVHAFVDAQDHLDLLIVPASETGEHARIIVGPPLAMIHDPQHKALLEVKILQGTQIIVSASGPYEVSWLSAGRDPGTQWLADTSAKPQNGRQQ